MTTPHKPTTRMGGKCPKLTAPCMTLTQPKSNNHIIIAQQQINNAYNIIMQMDAKYNRQINKFTKNFHPTQSKATQTLNKHRIIQLTQARHNLHKYLQTLNILQIQIEQMTYTGNGTLNDAEIVMDLPDSYLDNITTLTDVSVRTERAKKKIKKKKKRSSEVSSEVSSQGIEMKNFPVVPNHPIVSMAAEFPDVPDTPVIVEDDKVPLLS